MSLPSLRPPLIRQDSTPRLVKHVSFKPTVSIVKPTMPRLLIERNKFIDNSCHLIHQLHIPVENVSLTFNSLKSEYISWLKSAGYQQQFIENEVEFATIQIMRRLYFDSREQK